MMVRPVVVSYTKGPRAGAEYEIASAAMAKKAHPDATIVRFADTGEPYEVPSKANAPTESEKPA